MNANFYEMALNELRLVLAPLAGGAGDNLARPSAHPWQPLFSALGWDLDAIDGLSPEALSDLSRAFDGLFGQLSVSADGSLSGWADLRAGLELGNQLLDLVRSLDELVANPPPTWSELGEDLISYLVVNYLARRSPALLTAAVLVTLIDLPTEPPAATDWVVKANGVIMRRPYLGPRLRFDRLGDILADPIGTIKRRYIGELELATKAQAYMAADRLFPIIGALAELLGISSSYGMKPDTYGLPYSVVTRDLASHMLWLKLPNIAGSGSTGAMVAFSAADQGNLGLVVMPNGEPRYLANLGSWQIAVELIPGVQGFAIGPAGPTLIASPDTKEMEARLSATYLHTDQGAALLLGSAAGSHLKIGELSVGGAVSLDTTANHQGYMLTLGANASALVLPGLLTLSWDSLRWSASETTNTLAIANLRLQTDLLTDTALAGDMTLIFEDGQMQSGSSIHLREPSALDLPVTHFHLDDTCLSFTLREANINRWLSLISADLADRSEPRETEISFQLIFGGEQKELRIDWGVGAEARTFALPGINLSVPAESRFTLALTSKAGGSFNRLALALAVPRDKELRAESTFAWGRSGERELQNDDGRDPNEPALFSLGLKAKPSTAPNAQPIRVLLLELPLGSGGPPQFLRQLPPLAPGAPPCLPIELASTTRLDANDWEGELTLNLAQFKLPFLRNDAAGKEQAIQLSPPSPQTPFEIDFAAATIRIPVGASVKLGSLTFATELDFVFNWETFGLDVDHDAGIQLVAQSPEPQTGSFLNLDWVFKGALLTTGPNAGKYHYLTLITKDYNYEIQQAPGSEFSVSYSGISDEPIGFTITGLVIRPAGLSLEARVHETPVRIKGIDSKFRFSNSGFVMQDSRITEFTLAGSGALPPALVGDSSVDIFLHFGEQDGGLRLLDGTAVLRGNKLLKCKGTRFEFSIDKLGISFVQEGQFHLYFTLSGRAQFRLADGDDREGLLALLPNITIELVDCPLAGDVRVLAKHIRFLITLPRPKSFNLLGCFELELRGFGFLPQAEMFDGDGAMWLSGQVKFADGAGDSKNDQVDFHSLYIGLPKPGSLLPRIHFEQLVVDVKIADQFQLYAMVKYVDTENARGFSGEGLLRVAGLPKFEAAFSFLRVRSADTNAWVRAWFIYAQVSELSLMIPVVQLYIREIGFGLGYRYTLAMIKAADEERDVKKLLKALDKLAASQGELAKLDSWQVDIDGPGDPRFTLVLRAMISQTSASGPTSLARAAEQNIACTFLFDAVLAFRSDLTFLITARGWIYTNYVDYVDNVDGLRRRPFFFAYILLSAPQKRFLARMGNTPGGYIGNHPPMPEFIKTALQGVRFRATLLIEPGLFHLDLGWPNQLGWSGKLGPISVSITGGFIFRISRRDLVIGVSYMARGSMEISGGVSAGIAGVRVYARADVAYGMRYIGVLSFDDPLGKSLFYGAAGFELMIQFAIEFWIELFIKTIRMKFSFMIAFSAALEFGLDGTSPGVRGQGTLALKVCGRSFRVSIKIAANEDAVTAALKRTEEYMKLGLDADDSGGPPEPVPGTTPAVLDASAELTRRSALIGGRLAQRIPPVPMLLGEFPDIASPHYSIFTIHEAHPSHQGWSYFVIFPRSAGLPLAESEAVPHRGFLPVPPAPGSDADDFTIGLGTLGAGLTIEHVHISGDTIGWETPEEQAFSWRANWDAQSPLDVGDRPEDIQRNTVGNYLAFAFVGTSGARRDPDDLGELEQEPLADERVYNPSERDFEAAVRGAFAQFQGSPFFKHDPDLAYDKALDEAFQPTTTIYVPTAQAQRASDAEQTTRAIDEQQHADQIRGTIVHAIVTDLQEYARAESPERQASIARRSLGFQMGLVFRFKGSAPWLDSGDASAIDRPTITQRQPDGGMGIDRKLWVFNTTQTSFKQTPPSFSRVRHYTNASTIAIAWDLAWEKPPEGCVGEQADPEHHLAYYRVLRRALNSSERDLIYTVKSAEVLHRSPNGQADTLKLLKPRFQVVDHFIHETPAEQAALPASGRSYLYTITPIDNAGIPGRPLTLVATRYPDRAPRVPTDARLRVRYTLAASLLDGPRPEQLTVPELIVPSSILAEWSELPPGRDESRVPIKRYRLVFRRSRAVPVGSYGLDSTTQRSAASLTGSAVARPLPTDILIDLPQAQIDGEARSATVPLALLQASGVFPAGAAPTWQPDSWDVFIQTIALNDVPSSLAPAQIVIEAVREAISAERQPAELEWLPMPLDLPLLPPEDQRAILGDAHFPMPLLTWAEGQPSATFDGEHTQLGYQRHPAGIRCARIRWNQGPSAHPAYPLDLTAGFALLELDIDAYTTDTFADADRLAQALRVLQELRMVPSADLPFIPGGTLEPSQWEAWYPSAIQRRFEQEHHPVKGSQSPFSPWYSWRESLLEWPSPTVAGGPAWRSGDLHPFLQALVDRLDGVLYREPATLIVVETLDALEIKPLSDLLKNNQIVLTDQAAVRTISPGIEWRIDDDQNTTALYEFDGKQVLLRTLRVVRADKSLVVSVDSPYVIDRQELVPAQMGDFTGFLDATPAKADPYGWAVLQAFGLSTTFALRNSRTAQPILGDALLDALKRAIDDCLKLPRYAAFKKHLFIELLFQPGRSVELDELQAQTKDLLASVQVSLRPAIVQQRAYATLHVGAPPKISPTDPAKVNVSLVFKLAANQQIEIINLAERGSGQQTIDAASGIGTLDVSVPAGGTAQLIIRTGPGDAVNPLPSLPTIGFALPKSVTLSDELGQFFSVETNGSAFYLFLKPALLEPGVKQDARFLQLLAKLKADEITVSLSSLTYPQALAPTDGLASDFSAPQEALAQAFGDAQSMAGQHWLRFKTYIDAVYTSAATTIVAPGTPDTIAAILPMFLSWSQRFFEAAGTISFNASNALVGSYGSGPWPATAYPRSSTPAYVTPDSSGRLTYNHLLQDKWAHTFRYYLKPYNRYARLMDALRDALRPPDALLATVRPVATPDPQAGGLDLVVERTQPLAAPLVLFSGRLDESGKPDQPAPPGSTWEVIVAQHPEQALSERNQTLRRRLAFRQIAFTLQRRFADSAWLVWLAAHQPKDHPLTYRVIEQTTQPIPCEYPALPDHIDLPALRGDETGLNEIERAAHAAERRSLDLPLRLRRFQQGALVLQWEGLPFYYEHRLLLIAQADSQVSAASELIQRDFEYRSPLPMASAAGAKLLWPPDAPFQPQQPISVRGREVRIPLRRFWDSLPTSAMARWDSEDPGDAPYSAARTWASLPDHEVVYQVVELFGGNLEVQAELFFGPKPQPPASPPDTSEQAEEYDYLRRQLGKRVLANQLQFAAPPDGLGDYQLTVQLAQFIELQLSQTYPAPPDLTTTALDGNRLLIAGTLDPQSYTALRRVITQAPDLQVLDDFYNAWRSREPVSVRRWLKDPPTGVPDNVRGVLNEIDHAGLATIEPSGELALVWSGPLSDADRTDILALTGDDDFTAALARLVTSATAAQNQLEVVEPLSLLPSQRPAGKPEQLSFLTGPDGAINAVRWDKLMSPEQADALQEWADQAGEPDLRAAIKRLIPATQAAMAALVARESAPRGIDQPPTVAEPLQPLFNRLTIEVDQGQRRTKNLIWTGTLYDDERAQIEPLLRAWAQIGAFRTALDALLAKIDGRSLDETGRVRPAQADLPQAIRANLLLGASSIDWQGDPPTPTQRQAAASIVADTRLTNAINLLLGQLDNPNGQAVPFNLAEGTTPPVVPDALASRLHIEGAASPYTLRWSGPVPNAGQQAALAALQADPLIGSSTTALLALIDGLRHVALPAPPAALETLDRPELITLKDLLQVSTDAGATSFSWRGRLHHADQRLALDELQGFLARSNEYRGLAPALQRIIAALDTPIVVQFEIALRPQQTELPDDIRSRLLLGRFTISFQGLMTGDEGRALSWLYADLSAEPPPTELTQELATADTRAVERLYAATLQKGMRGRELKIRARRANAAPSLLRSFEIAALIGAPA